MKPARFGYHRAHDLPDAFRLLQEHGDEAKVIAGGQSLVAMMNFRLARPEHLIDIAHIAGLRYVRRDAAGLRIGALTTHHDVETEPLGAAYDVLSRTMSWLGHLPIRTQGTVGGSIAHADATAEWCLLAVFLDAIVVLEGPGGRRDVPAARFFQGRYTTVLAQDELVVELHFPHPAPHAAVVEHAERKGEFAELAAAVQLDVVDGRVRSSRVALAGVGAVPNRIPEAEAELAGGALNAALFDRCADAAAARIVQVSADADLEHHRSIARHLVRSACRQAATP